MGPLPEVRKRLSETAPDIDWSDPAWGRLQRAGFSIEINLGDEDPCTGFALHVRGGSGAVAVVEALVRNNGWYALDASQGEWLHHVGSLADSHRQFSAFRDRMIADRREEPSGS